MPLDIEQALGIHSQALLLRAERAGVLSSNLANADTPNYKARDLDFAAALQGAAQSAPRLQRTNALHLAAQAQEAGGTLKYRVAMQPSLDGNTVDTQLEQAAFAENAVQYQTSLEFLSNKLRGILGALRGE